MIILIKIYINFLQFYNVLSYVILSFDLCLYLPSITLYFTLLIILYKGRFDELVSSNYIYKVSIT